MIDSEDVYCLFYDPVDNSVIPYAQCPTLFEGSTQRLPENTWLARELSLNGSLYTIGLTLRNAGDPFQIKMPAVFNPVFYGWHSRIPYENENPRFW